MTPKYREFLAARVITEGKVVTHRLLYHALNVDHRQAKRMLFDFHDRENKKKPGSVYAYYWLSGLRRSQKQPETQTTAANTQDDEDTIMQSSPFVSSAPQPEEEEEEEEPPLVQYQVLAGEDELEDAKAKFESISTIFVHTVAPGRLKTLRIISACNFEVATKYRPENPLEAYKTYGIYHNPNAKQRTPRTKPPEPTKPAPAASKPSTKPAAASACKPTAAETTKPAPSKSDSSKPPASLKREKSNLFNSFAKQAAQSKKPAPPKPTAAPSKPALTKPGAHAAPPAEATSAPQDADMEDVSSASASDGENEPTAQKNRAATQETQRTRSAREEALRKMMEDDDDDEEGGTADTKADGPPTPTKPADEDAEMEDSQDAGALDAPPSKPAVAEKKEQVVVVNGRRRGKRQVMKTRRYKDEDGFLVSKEEAVWESFSEEEPVAKKAKPMPAPSGGKKGAAGAKKVAPKGGIMGYFGKK